MHRAVKVFLYIQIHMHMDEKPQLYRSCYIPNEEGHMQMEQHQTDMVPSPPHIVCSYGVLSLEVKGERLYKGEITREGHTFLERKSRCVSGS